MLSGELWIGTEWVPVGTEVQDGGPETDIDSF